MRCPLCFQPLGEDTLYVNKAENIARPRHITVEPRQRFERAGEAGLARDERLVSHEVCGCLHPLVKFEGREEDAQQLLNSAQRIEALELRECVSGVLGEDEWGALKAASNEHWSFVRMRYLAANPDLKSMWFPERLFPFEDEAPSILRIMAMGPRRAGKSVFATLAGSGNTYGNLGEGVDFQDNYCYAAPRLASKPSQDYEELLRALRAVRYQAAEIAGTEKQSSLLVAAFFNGILPSSEVDSVAVYDIAGELYERNYSIRANAMSSPDTYWCILIAAEDLLLLNPNARTVANSVEAAVELLRSADQYRRVVIAVTKMDSIAVPKPSQSQSPARRAALVKLTALLSTRGSVPPRSLDPQQRREAHGKGGADSRRLLTDLLVLSDSREKDLERLLRPGSKVRAVFFTGVDGWETPGAAIRPFGIGESICWMAEDLSDDHFGAPGIVTQAITWLTGKLSRKGRAPRL